MEDLVKRLKSFLWRAFMIGVAAALAWAAENVGLLELPELAVLIVGLVFGEISKQLNKPAPAA